MLNQSKDRKNSSQVDVGVTKIGSTLNKFEKCLLVVSNEF